MKFTVSRVQKFLFARMGVAIVIMIAACALPLSTVPRLCLFLLSYLLAGYDVLWESVKSIGHGRVFSETFLMSIATIGAIAIGEYPEAVIVMVLYQIGEFFEDYAEERSRKSIADLMDITPETAVVLRNGKEETVAPESVSVGEIIIVHPGMKVPIDGVVTDGASSLDTSTLTGEALPRTVEKGDDVISGCINREGLLQVKTTKTFRNSAVSRILELVEQASAKKAKSEKFIDTFVRWYTPAVVGVAVLVVVIPPLLFGQPWIDWISRALIFLVVSCPCALVISIPLTVFCGIGAGSRQGILIKGGNYLEMLARTESIVFDKTGTVTKGEFVVTEYDDDEALRLASIAGCESTHPLSVSLQMAYHTDEKPDKVTEISGRGIEAEIQGNHVLSGSRT
ncbi:MAG TPA: cadmium family heavy metal-translocating P-type ATPase, partial [Methanocorpusculum sp.]|nr:cadmium family heavy metal-translocating P-type ATPase [Methanocorpusculum sp.]